MAAVGKFVLWGKENLCLIRPLGESLALETLFFAEDIRSRSEIDEAVEETEVKDPELEMARQLVESLVGDFDPEDYENEYRNELRAMLEAKLAGKEIAEPPGAGPGRAGRRPDGGAQERRPGSESKEQGRRGQAQEGFRPGKKAAADRPARRRLGVTPDASS